MKVFIAGPRAVNILNKDMTNVLSRIMNKELIVLLGDANGVDCLAQEYFANAKYLNVRIYACNNKARNNIGGWTVQNVEVPTGIRGFDYYSQKDIRMARDADNGFMIWNGKSQGTLNNIINLTSQNKKTMIYYIPTSKTINIDNLSDMENMAKSISPDTYTLFHKLCKKSVTRFENEHVEQLSIFEMFQ